MARYELGAVYKINAIDGIVYYVRLLERDCYGVFAPFQGIPDEDILSKTPYVLYFVCNNFAVKRGIWEKVLSSPDQNDIERWKSPDLANYANYNSILSFQQSRIFHKGDTYRCEKEKFVEMVKLGLIESIFDRHENVPPFLMRYYEGWPSSYIFDKVFLQSGTIEHQKEQLKVLNEMGFDTKDI